MSSSASPSSTTTPTEPMVVYSIHGSQFTAKVLSALQHRKIPHYVQSVPLNKKERVKVIPSGGYLVPEIKVGTGDSAIIVSDSEKILHWVDEHFPVQAKFYPDPLCSEISVRASDGKLAGFVWYYNWVDHEGFARSILPAVRGALPSWLNPIVPNFLLEMPLKSERVKFRKAAARVIGVNDEKDLDDEPRMREILVEELTFFQSHLKDPEQPYLVPGTTQPTAADFSVYPQVERLVGGGEGIYDVWLEPAMPLLSKVGSLQRLWDWHQRMRQNCPVQFKGKKPPKEIV